jgi:Fic family protein
LHWGFFPIWELFPLKFIPNWQIRNIHRLILKNIDDEKTGSYRNINAIISGASRTPPNHIFLKDQMSRFIDWYHSETNYLHPTERAAKVHADFVSIHPFIELNQWADKGL